MGDSNPNYGPLEAAANIGLAESSQYNQAFWQGQPLPGVPVPSPDQKSAMGTEAYPLPEAVGTSENLIGSLYNPSLAPPVQQQVFSELDPMFTQLGITGQKMLGEGTSGLPQTVSQIQSASQGLLGFYENPPPEIQNLINTSNQIMTAYQKGQLPKGQDAIFQAARQRMTNQLNATFASLGLVGSTAQAEALGMMDIQLAGAKGELLNQDLQLAQSGLQEAESLRLNAAQLGLGGLGTVGALQQEMISDSMAAIGMAQEYGLTKSSMYTQNLSLGEALRQSEQWPLEYKLSTAGLYSKNAAAYLGMDISAQDAILAAQIAEQQMMWGAIGSFFGGIGSLMGYGMGPGFLK